MTSYHDKYADQVVRDRLMDESFQRLRGALFVAALGPLAIGLIYYTKATVSTPVKVAIIATAPLGLLLLLINYFRIPGGGKASGRAVRTLLLTLALVIATPILAKQFGLL